MVRYKFFTGGCMKSLYFVVLGFILFSSNGFADYDRGMNVVNQTNNSYKIGQVPDQDRSSKCGYLDPMYSEITAQTVKDYNIYVNNSGPCWLSTTKVYFTIKNDTGEYLFKASTNLRDFDVKLSETRKADAAVSEY